MGEDHAAAYLKKQGYKIIDRNYRKNYGEIDIIARKGRVTCFVEVKTRKPSPLGEGEQAITPAKKKRIVAAAQRFISEVRSDCEDCRFDVAVVTVSDNVVMHLKYYVGAFDGSKQ